MAGAAPLPDGATRAPHIPPEGSKQYALLTRLLHGERVDPFTALMEMNLLTINARVSELRKMGWPVQSRKDPHPKLKGERVVVYFFDQHFRQWIVENPHLHPEKYPGQEGRGKFAKDTSTAPLPSDDCNQLQRRPINFM